MIAKLLLAATGSVAIAQASLAQEPPVRIGLLLGFTGPVEYLVQDMAASADIAFREASASGLFLGGRSIEIVRGDSTCVDAAAATAAAERLVIASEVSAILGAACSGATTAVANNVAIPNGIVLISPSATSPALSHLDDRGLFFRTAPSDARQGEVLAEIVAGHDIDSVAITYTNNDQGSGLADAFGTAFTELGGSVEMVAAHEDGRGDYTAEVAALAASGADHLVVIGYVDQGGSGIIRTALDLGAFEYFILPDGMIGDALLAQMGSDLEGSLGSVPGSETDEHNRFQQLAREAGIVGVGPYQGESYDAAALLILAMQAADSTSGPRIADEVMTVANAPGVEIGPGEIERGLRILLEGGDIDYVGATGVEFSDAGEASGTYREIVIEDHDFRTIRLW